jgi:NAD(P)-dependent dehydrogenase (short-subunit alcohol dehydrogenase family)
MLQQRWGRIVVTASMGGRMGIKGQSAYTATTWGVFGLAKSWQRALSSTTRSSDLWESATMPWTTLAARSPR